MSQSEIYGTKPKEATEAELADVAKMKKIGLWAGGIALLMALLLGVGPILLDDTVIRDSNWHEVSVVSSGDPSVKSELDKFTGMRRSITIGDWEYHLKAGKLVATAVSGEFAGTVELIGVGTTPVALIELDGWIIVGNNGGNISGQISGSQKRSVSFVDPSSNIVAETLTIGDEALNQAEFMSLMEVDGDLWVISKVDQLVRIFEAE